MTSAKYTHIGFVVGVDNRTPSGWGRSVQLRETKKMWISDCGYRFMKNTMKEPGRWPVYALKYVLCQI